MGGLWAHPIKLLDGFWLAIDGDWLPPASSFTSGPFWNEHTWELSDGLAVLRRQFVPDGIAGLVVRYAFRSHRARCLTLRFVARTDLRGVWASAPDGTAEGRDDARFDDDLGAFICTDTVHDWALLIGARDRSPATTAVGRQQFGPQTTRGTGVSIALEYQLALEAGEEADLTIVAAGSHMSLEGARADFLTLRDEVDAVESRKMSRYTRMLQKSVLTTPEAPIDVAWDWLKCNNDWLVRDVPGVGRGLGAGLDDYPWWFGCDTAYAVLGCLALGQGPIAIETLDLVRTLSERANGPSGRILHEANTWGRVVHPGCTQETPHFTNAVWDTFRWTGDLDFLRRSYDFCKRGVLEWTLGERCTGGELLPYGYGIIEVDGLDLQCIDTATHTVTALAALSRMARVLGDDVVARTCDALHARASASLEESFWLEDEGIYGDIRGTPAEMAPRLGHIAKTSEHPVSLTHEKPEVVAELRHMAERAQSAPHSDRKEPWLLKNWTVISPVVEGLASPERARRVLERVEGPEFFGPWGMYLNGIDRTHQMSINTGALALAEIRYGRVEEGLARIRMLVETLEMHMPGAISEMSPDYGCFVQAWSAYAVAWPVVNGLFGIQPDAHERRITVAPCFPTKWGEALLENVPIGDTMVSFHWDGHHLQVSIRDPGWTVVTQAGEHVAQHVET